jgi:hypothetical protein
MNLKFSIQELYISFAKIKNITHRNHQLTVPQVAEKAAISIGSCHIILIEDLGMLQISANFVSRLLIDDLQRANDNENLLRNVRQ